MELLVSVGSTSFNLVTRSDDISDQPDNVVHKRQHHSTESGRRHIGEVGNLVITQLANFFCVSDNRPMNVTVEAMTAADWPSVRAIYLEGIATGQATYETEAPEWDAWDRAHLAGCRLVARGPDGIAGWAALSPVSGRCVYAGVAEVSVYVAAAARGRGVGKALLNALVAASEAAGIWTLQAGIFPENKASVALHTACGFRIIGRRERLGQLHGAWRDVLLMERRSPIVGIGD